MVAEPADRQVDVWSEHLEEELIEAGMEPPQAKAYRRAFELGLTRVLSQTATKQELLLTKQELQDSIDRLRADMHHELDRVHREIAQLRDDTHREIGQLRSEMAQLRAEMHHEIDQLRDEMGQLRDDLRREMGIRSGYIILTMTIGFGIMAGLMGAILARM